MADKKITALSALGTTDVDPAADLLHIIDYSASPVNKKITVANLFDQVNTNTSIYGVSKVLEVGYAAAVNSHIRVEIGSGVSPSFTDGAVTINDDGVAYVDFVVKSLGSDQAFVVDAGADTVTVNGDSIAALDFVVKGDTTTLIHCDGGLDAVGLGTVTPDTAYTVTVAATGTNGIKSLGSIDITGSIDTTGITTTSTVAHTAAGAIPITARTVNMTVSGTTAYTLADGGDGQEITLTCVAVASTPDGTITPASRNGFATLDMDAVGETFHLIFTNSKWNIISNYAGGVT